MSGLGLGLGWRPQLAAFVLRRPDLGFVEVVAESLPADRPPPLGLVEARRRGLAVVPHGVGLGLGDADPPDPGRLEHLSDLSRRLGAPLVSEHVAFVRAGGQESGHLQPLPRTRAALEVLIENVSIATASLPVPLALEPVASLFEWPDAEIDEADFLTELVERTGALLLLDVANVYANARNRGESPLALIDRLPLDRVAYVHVAGGSLCDGLYHDTHAAAVPPEVLDLLDALLSRCPVPGAMLERDDAFPPAPAISAELDAIAALGGTRRSPWRAMPGPPGRPEPRRPDPRLAPVRRSLAADQLRLVQALLGRGSVPAGFDPEPVHAAAAALDRKKERADRRGTKDA